MELIRDEKVNHAAKSNNKITFRAPNKKDGLNVNKLIKSCPPLDTNSAYCNFLQSSHFRQTCVVAEMEGNLVGFLSAYRQPENPHTLFVWQIAVAEIARGHGLALTMLKSLIARPALADITAIETTITEDNRGSWRTFEKFDAESGGGGTRKPFLYEQDHFKGKHETEILFHIPLKKQPSK